LVPSQVRLPLAGDDDEAVLRHRAVGMRGRTTRRVCSVIFCAALLALAGCGEYGEGSSEGTSEGASDCAAGYSPCVPDVPYDLDCADIGFSVSVTGSDPYGFDGDGDGYGCETW